ncbi:malto-oligosyltrehalose synthase [Sulfitobacter sp. D35]|uniref:malto-oligosyltrehalose synthase n=1 Tax=Sulfitobacter sp. D35 TaxID=3083252 RepID=UPI002970042E|nr:malto-oligosyltrehalose synthase [Sulfitobacter sp. D35]MDW4499751.1 malto-oligosyltrehalose synthase [Sulfitobacter sp. D35]
MTRLPSACYRLQFRNGVDFAAAEGLVPYLAGLGISHLYSSPLFSASTGSTHGYDITDPAEIDPVLGGLEGLKRLSAALKAEGLGLILDIVPNHLAFSVETPWLRDVLRHGAESPYARHFDTDLAAVRLRLPWLEQPFEDVLASGILGVADAADGPVLTVGDGLRIPLARSSALDAARDGDPAALRRLHDDQPWRLAAWRTEADAITHRRFFNVTGLIGVRVEDEAVFEDVHRLLFDLVDDGVVDGVRIDHIDGLADPGAYLDRLKARLGETPIWIEKILSGRETLPPDWPVEGTTGYVAARALARLLTDGAGLEAVEEDYRAATGRTEPVADVMDRARRQIMTHDLAAELWTLQTEFARIAQFDPRGVEWGPEALRTALIAYISAFPQYRTYSTKDDVSEGDARTIRRTAERAASRQPTPGALPFLAEVLTRSDADTAAFRVRMQQVTGAAVAKSQEDTAFYREVRLLALNEVGSELDDDALGVDGFHRAMQRRVRDMPHGLTLTSSHDTKRSEDARMRIAAVTHAPQDFHDWFRICAGFAPEALNPNLVWYAAQSFLALDQGDGDMGARLANHIVKALREAKSETFWTAPDLELEAAAQSFLRRLAEHFPRHAPEVGHILQTADRLSVAQLVLKLTIPGIPDIYQGCELASYALTDPDNRREVDFDELRKALSGEAGFKRPLDVQKFHLTRRLLGLRREHAALFLNGGYQAIEAPAGVCAFTRRDNSTAVHVAVAVLPDAEVRSLDLPAGRDVLDASEVPSARVRIETGL